MKRKREELNGNEIQALKLGLTRDQLGDHKWDNDDYGGRTGEQTLKYISERPGGTTAPEAMDNIRGLQGNQIQALKLGLTRDQLGDHDWYNDDYKKGTGEQTLKYISKRSEGITALQAMESIRGSNGNQIIEVTKYIDIGLNKLRLTPQELYAQRFDKERFEKVAKPILTARAKGAAESAFSKTVTPFCVAGKIADAEANNLACNKAGTESQDDSHSNKLDEMRANNNSGISR